MIKKMESLSLLDILPANLLSDKRVAAAAQALDAELQAVTKATTETIHLPRLDELPEAVVDLLAWQWHVDFYELGMDIETKRKLVRESIAWHRIKGTPAAVEKVIQTIFDSGKVSEWFEYGGEPYHFKIDLLSTPQIVQEDLEKVVNVVNAAKNARSKLDSLGFIREAANRQYYGTAPHIHKRFGVAQILHAETSGTVFIGAITTNHKNHTVKQVSPVYDAVNQLVMYSGAAPASHKRYKV